MEVTTTEEAVEVIPGTSVTLRVTFDRISEEVQRGDGRPPLRVDSADPSVVGAVDESDKEAVQFHRSRGPILAMVGKSLEGTWRESGMLLKFEGLESLRTAMAEGRPAEDPFRKAVDQIVNPASLHHLLRPHLVVGERSLSPGEKRNFQDMGFLPESVGGVGYAYYKGTYALKEVADGVARVEMEADVSLDPQPGMPPWPAALAEFRNRLRLVRGTCRAWARVEPATGRLLEDEHLTELDLRLSPEAGAPEIPLPTKKTRRLKLIK